MVLLGDTDESDRNSLCARGEPEIEVTGVETPVRIM